MLLDNKYLILLVWCDFHQVIVKLQVLNTPLGSNHFSVLFRNMMLTEVTSVDEVGEGLGGVLFKLDFTLL